MRENSHTIRDFKFDKPLLPIVEKWAKNHSFSVVSEQTKITCVREMGLMTAPVHVILEESGKHIHFEAFLKADPLTMFSSLFMAPNEMHLESGEGQLFLERIYGRGLVNKLLEQLDQPHIE